MQNDTRVVKCRPTRSIWVIAIVIPMLFFAVMIVTMLTAKNRPADLHGDHLVLSLMGFLLFIPGIMCVVYGLRARIVTDGAWLRWRHLGSWKAVRWEQVSDFYDKRLPNGQTVAVIETPVGELIASENNWTNTQVLKDVAVNCAKRTSNRTWAERGSRKNENWPLTFDYNTPDNRFLRFGFPVLIAIVLVLRFSYVHTSVLTTWRTLGWTWGVGTLLVDCMAFAMPLLVPAILISLKRHRNSSRFDRITATQNSIEFKGLDRSVLAAWSDVTRLSVPRAHGCSELSGTRVETTQGNFEFTQSLGGYRVLRNLLACKTPEAFRRGIEEATDTDTLPVSFSVKPYEQAFHYRTRLNRALLLLPTFMSISLSLMFTAHKIPAARDLFPDPGLFAITVALVVGSGALYGWQRFLFGRIIVDDMGVTQYLPLGTRRILWGDVKEYYITESVGVIADSKARIRFRLRISDIDKLKEYVARHANKSLTPTWLKRNGRN